MSLTYPQNVTLYQVGDSVAWNPATNNNFLDAIDPSSLSEVDARLMETADRLIGVDAHLSMLRATPIAEQPRPSTEDPAPWSSFRRSSGVTRV